MEKEAQVPLDNMAVADAFFDLSGGDAYVKLELDIWSADSRLIHPTLIAR